MSEAFLQRLMSLFVASHYKVSHTPCGAWVLLSLHCTAATPRYPPSLSLCPAQNSPNDLQLMSDAPAHRIFALLGPVDMAAAGEGKLPDILCAVQVILTAPAYPGPVGPLYVL